MSKSRQQTPNHFIDDGTSSTIMTKPVATIGKIKESAVFLPHITKQLWTRTILTVLGGLKNLGPNDDCDE